MKGWRLNAEAILGDSSSLDVKFNKKLYDLVGNKDIVEIIYDSSPYVQTRVIGFKLADGVYVCSVSGTPKLLSERPKDISSTLVLPAEIQRGFLKEVEINPITVYHRGNKVEVISSTDKYHFVRNGDEEYLIPNEELVRYPDKGCLVIKYDLYPYYNVVKYDEIVDNIWFKTNLGKYSLTSASIKKVYPYDMYDVLNNECNTRRDALEEIKKTEGDRLLSSGIYVEGK